MKPQIPKINIFNEKLILKNQATNFIEKEILSF